MIKKVAQNKKFFCGVKTITGISSTFRILSGNTLGEVIDRAVALYRTSWRKYPDSIELTCKNIVK